MPKLFYIATRKDRSADAEPLLEALHAEGWQRTFAWSSEDDNDEGNWPRLACAELDGVRQANVLIVLLPGGYGTHVEIGAALALEKAVIIHSLDRQTLETPYPCVFHYHPRVTLFVSKVIDVPAVAREMERSLGGAHSL
jgi:hypothetical protein